MTEEVRELEVVEPETGLVEFEELELQKCERVIAGGIKQFFEVGHALMKVRDLRLYRVQYPTFEAYMQDRWDYSRQYGYNLIYAAEAAERVSAIGLQPSNERQVRPLVGMEPDDQLKAWRKAVEIAREENGGRMTAAIVSRAIRLITEKPVDVDQTNETEKHDIPPSDTEKAMRDYGKIEATASRLNDAIRKFLNNHGGDNDLFTIKDDVMNLSLRLTSWKGGWFGGSE